MIMNRLLVPWGVSIEVTARCNLDCIHCYHPRAEGGELSFDEMTSLLDDLADLGSMDLTFSGGEPFTRNDFLDILDYAVERRGFHVKIFSNLTLLTEEKADRLASYPLNAVETTILGPDSECHDRLARHKGAFEATVRSIRMLVERNVNVSAKTVAMKGNCHRLDELYALADSLGISFRNDDSLFVEADGGRSPLSLQISDDEIIRLRKSRGHDIPTEFFACNCGKSVLSISADGNVHPCGPFPVPGGNIREKSLAEIWRNSPVFNKVRELDNPDYEVCRDCRFNLRCNGCIAMGMGLSNNRVYPCALKKRKLRHLP